jgi:hypothetical protein
MLCPQLDAWSGVGVSGQEHRPPELKVRLHYRAKWRVLSMLDEFARRLFDKIASSKASKSALLLGEQTRRLNSDLCKRTFRVSLVSEVHRAPTESPTIYTKR